VGTASCPAHDAVLDVRDLGRGDDLHRLERRVADVLEQPLAGADRRGA
jgi:hypothetical protein